MDFDLFITIFALDLYTSNLAARGIIAYVRWRGHEDSLIIVGDFVNRSLADKDHTGLHTRT